MKEENGREEVVSSEVVLPYLLSRSQESGKNYYLFGGVNRLL